MRILHYSDPHIPTPLRRVPLGKWLSKRAIGGANLLLGRYRFFSDGVRKLEALARFTEEQQVDLIICTGDYTALGLNHEYEEAVRVTSSLMEASPDYIHVPGNHDYYITDALRDKRFQTYFGHTLQSDLPEYKVDDPWPTVRLIDPTLAVIGVNSSRPNPLPWRSSGRVPDKQLKAIAKLSRIPELAKRLVLIITHYAPLLANGKYDSRLHGLMNAESFLATCALFPKAIILCGHVHNCFHVLSPETGHSIFCAGSVTMEKKEAFWLFTFAGGILKAMKGQWNGQHYQLELNSSITLF